MVFFWASALPFFTTLAMLSGPCCVSNGTFVTSFIRALYA